MKYKSLFAMAAASLTMLFACEKPVDLGPEEVTIVSSDVLEEIPVDGGEYTIELKATLDWSVQNYEGDVTSWLNITPSRGSASADNQTVSIKVLPNDGANRSFDIVFYGNIMHSASLTINQTGPKGDGTEGTGTVDNPFNVAAAIKYIDENEYYGDADNPNVSPEVYVKGTIASIEEVDPSFGNATYVISDGEGTAELEVYRGKYLNGDKFTSEDQIKVGDEVVVAGQLTRFFETYEFTTGSRIHSLNGEEGEEPVVVDPVGSGTAEDPFNVAAAYKFIDDGQYYGDADNPNVSPEKYVKGVITSIEEVDTGQYGNATYVISDGEGTAELEVYRGYYLNGEKFTSKDQIKVGDEVVVVGQLTRFFETYEFTKGSKIYSINDGGSGGEDPDDPTEEPTSATPITIAEFLQKPVNNTDWYELTGEIVSIVSGNAYGNFTIKDDTGSVYIYGMVQAWAGGKNDQSFNKIGLKVGDSVTLWSLRDEHDGQPQGGGSDIPAIYKSHEEGATVTYPEGTVFLTFPDGNQKSVSSYTDTWTAICDGYTFTIANFNNNKNGWSYIKCGREKAASVATIANATAMPELSSIEVSVDNVTKASSVNSVTLTIYSDEANSSQVGEPIAWTDYSAGVWEFAIPEGVQAENLYYKLTFDCAPHGSSNGIIQISKVTYIAAE